MRDCKYCREMDLWREGAEFICEDEDWLIRHHPKPYSTFGWTILYARRHTSSLADFDARQQAAFGPMAAALALAVREATGCSRVYVASLNEGVQHFHMHFLPRYADGPTRWNAFLEMENAQAMVADENVAILVAELRRKLETPARR